LNRKIAGDNDNYTYKLFRNFLDLKETDFFGGRSLIVKAGDSEEGSGMDPSQLAVVADSAEVEVLIMERNCLQFFPDSIKKQIMRQIEQEKCIERPFTDE